MIESYGRTVVGDAKVAQKLHSMLQAQILAQIDYWADRTNNIHKGFKWVYNSMEDWHKQFDWVALSTLKRAFSDLEKQGLLVTTNLNKIKYDRTKWYRVDYAKLEELMTPKPAKIIVTYTKKTEPAKTTDKPIVQNEPMDKSNLTQTESVKINQPIPRDYQEITHNINNTQISKSQSQSVNRTDQQQPTTPTKSNKRYYEQYKKNQSAKSHYYKPFKKHIEKATDWSKHVADKCDTDMDSIQQWFANFEAQTFGDISPQI